MIEMLTEDVVEEYMDFLDFIRESGMCNMYGAGVYLQEEFDLSKKDAREILIHWMNTYDERHPV